MKFPKINKQPSRSVTVPKLSGGINLRDAVTMVQDNQLTDSKNMWYKDNILKTRPGMYTNSNMKKDVAMLNEVENSGKPIDIYMTKNGKLYRLFYYEVVGEQYADTDYAQLESAAEGGMFWVSSDDIISLPKIYINNTIIIRTSNIIQLSNCFVNNKKHEIYKNK